MRGLILGLSFVMAAGCGAARMQTVAEARWQTVPQGERDSIDKPRQDDLSKANGEVMTAQRELDKARQPQPSLGKPKDPMYGYALGKVDASRAAWQRANITWREQRLDAARAHIAVIQCDRELARAEAVDFHAGDDNGMDTTPYHAQLNNARDAWFRAQDRVALARKALDQAGEALANAKEEYAALVRAEPVASADVGFVAPMPW